MIRQNLILVKIYVFVFVGLHGAHLFLIVLQDNRF